MKQRIVVQHRRRLAAVAAACAALLAGCAMFNPYESAPLPEPAPDNGLRLAGGAAEALNELNGWREQYYSNLRWGAVTRKTAGTLGIGLSGWAVYNAARPAADGASALSGGVARRSVWLGATLASLYALRELFVNPGQEASFADTYRSLTCLMLQSAPLLMTEANLPAGTAAARAVPQRGITVAPTAPAQTLPPLPRAALAQARPPGTLDALRDALELLEAQIELSALQMASIDAAADSQPLQSPEARAVHKPLQHRIGDARRALSYARNALADGRVLVRVVEGSGREIRTRAATIVAAANGTVQAQENEPVKAEAAIKAANDITTAVMNLGNATAADQATVGAAAQATQAPGGDWQRVFTAAPAKPKAAAKPAPAPFDLEMLKSFKASVDAQVKALEAAHAEAAAQKEKERYQKEIDALREALEDTAGRFAQRLTCGRAAADGGCTAMLAEQTEALYAARRPVAQALLEFRELTRRMADTPVCNELATLRVTPNDVRYVRPGDTVNYVISQRVAENPFATLQGPTDATTGAKFVFSGIGGSKLHQASVTIGKQMPQQRMHLVVTDSKGISSLVLPIVVASPLKALEPPASASPAAPGNDGKSPPGST